MSTREQHTPTIPTPAVRNTGGRSGPQGLEEPTSDEVLRELCDKNYHQLLPLIVKKMQKEKEQQDKLNAVMACLLYGDESGRNSRNHEESNYFESKTPTARTELRRRHGKSKDSERGHWKSKSKRHRSNTYEDDLSQPWMCEERNPFTPWIRHFDFPMTRMPSHIKTYDGPGDPEDHLKLFQSAAKTERLAMPTWCHMFNSMLTGNARVWFDKLPKESIDSYEDLRVAFRENYLQQTKHIKDPVEIHHIKQRDGESTDDFMERYKAEVLDVKGVLECMKIFGFMYGITHPELIKRLYKKILRSINEMYRVTTSFLQGEFTVFSHNTFSLLTKTPKEFFALEKGKFKAPPPMLRRQIEEMIKSGKFSQFIKELKQNDKPKAQKKGETAEKDKPLAILMIQLRERVAKQRVTQSFSPETVISFPSLGEKDGTEGLMIIETEIGGHFAPARNKKPDDPSYHITHRIQLRNYLAARTNIPTSKDRTGIRKIRVVPSTTHRMLKFLVEGGMVKLRSSRVIPMECAMISGPSTQHHATSQVLEENIKLAINPEYPEQTIGIGSTLTEKGRKELCALLRQNPDVFSWKPAGMTGVPGHIAEHRLNIRERCLPSRQKKRG
ncbi:reverse transcriptase domain-containing protein [Tanacetum coccineum]